LLVREKWILMDLKLTLHEALRFLLLLGNRKKKRGKKMLLKKI